MIDEVLKIYFDPSQGLTNAKNIYDKLNKKYTLKSIKDVLKNVKNKQIKSNDDEKLYIPITTPSHSFSADLTFYNQFAKTNNNYKILFCIINNNTKKAYVYPLKNKTTKSIIDAFKIFLNDVDNIDQLQCDFGSEFKSKEFQKICDDNNIKLTLFDTGENKNTMAIIERFNRTIRSKIDNYMTAYNTKKYIDVLDKLVNNYNNSNHSTIKDAPNNITEKKEKEISNNKLKDYLEVKQEINNTFQLGDSVRVLKKRKLFGKGPSEYYSKTLYEIVEMNNNKIIIRSNNNKVREVMPYQIKIVNDHYENPYLDNKNNSLSKQKKIIEKDKKDKKQKRVIKKEGLEEVNLEKIKKLERLKKQLN